MPAQTSVDSANHQRNRLVAALSPKAFSLLKKDLKEAFFKQGTVLIDAGDAIPRVYFPQSGMLSLLVVLADGGSIEAATIGREGSVGLQCGLGHRRLFTRATVQVSGNISFIPSARFEQAARDNSEIKDLISGYTEVLWVEAQQIIACNAAHGVDRRLCRWLLQTADRIESDVLPLTQEFISQMLGVQRTTVTLIAKTLQESGAIRYQRGKIHILDRRALEDMVCECYHAIQHEKLPPRIGVNFQPQRHL